MIHVANRCSRMLITHHTLKMETPLSISTPPNKKPSQVVRRSFTAPPKSRSSPISPLQTQDAVAEGAETLFESHACRIVSFHTSTRSWRHQAANRGSDVLNEPVGILPWASATETTKSTGMAHIRYLIVYRYSLQSVRLAAYLSSAWFGGFPQLRQHFASHFGKIAMLVRRWAIQICHPDWRPHILSNRAAESMSRRQCHDRGVQRGIGENIEI